MIGNLTKEQREEMLEKARIAREEKRKAGEHLEQDFGTDEAVWRSLASKYGVRLPASYIPNSEVKYLKRVAKALDIDLVEYLEDCGVKTLKQLAALNSNWPAWSEVGFLLEWWDEKLEVEKVLGIK